MLRTEKAIKLIEVAERLCPDAEHGEFGSTKTGFMEIDKLKELKKYLS